MKSGKNKRARHARLDMEYVVYPTTVCVVLLVVATFTGMWITGENPYRSYALQACAWLEGRLDLGMDYPWLELAIFEDVMPTT